MYLYNISIIVEESQHDSLITWVKNEWLPEITSQAKLLKMINTPHEGHTYCVQIIVADLEEINSFQENKLSLLQHHIALNHQEKAFIFDSIMQYL